MITREMQFDIFARIRAARLSRCGGDAWVQPPDAWAEIVRQAWPDVWGQIPGRVPSGWVDLIMAFSEHATEVAGTPRYHDAFENAITGKLVIHMFYDDGFSTGLIDIVQGYQQASSVICRVCGEPGDLRRHAVRPTRVLCDEHSGVSG